MGVQSRPLFGAFLPRYQKMKKMAITPKLVEIPKKYDHVYFSMFESLIKKFGLSFNVLRPSERRYDFTLPPSLKEIFEKSTKCK